jgi:hypothetical protein
MGTTPARVEVVWRALVTAALGVPASAQADVMVGGAACDMRRVFPDLAYVDVDSVTIMEADEHEHASRSCELAGAEARTLAPVLLSDGPDGKDVRFRSLHRLNVHQTRGSGGDSTMGPLPPGVCVGYLCYGSRGRDEHRPDAVHVLYDFASCDEAVADPVLGPHICAVLRSLAFFDAAMGARELLAQFPHNTFYAGRAR